MSKRQMISVVSPVYGCKNCLCALVDAIDKAFEQSGLDWELILVDDRAADHPWPKIVELAKKDNRVKGVRLTRNHGQHLAIWAGLEAANGDWVAVIDCDLQDDPSVVPTLYEKAICDGVDAVVVDRGIWLDTGFRRWASHFFYWSMSNLSGIRLNQNTGNFGIYSRCLIDTLLLFRDKEVFLPVMVSLTGFSQAVLTVDRAGRHAGKTSYNLHRLVNLAIAIIVRFSDRPLKLSVIGGVFFSGLSALCSIFVLTAWALGMIEVPGWSSLILSLWFLAGLILAVLGVHGIYIGRIFTEVQDRPRIFVEQTTEILNLDQ